MVQRDAGNPRSGVTVGRSEATMEAPVLKE
ncbi:hypothetical protein DV517_74490 [Streptomyces sp. S816]|nr:hypothetical protein DV517_74490 [Streptomyces sp. S816]